MKRKHFSIILAVIMVFVIMAPTLISQKAFAEEYTIKDPILRELMNKRYGEPADYNLSPEELSRIEYTGDYWMNKGIRTLEGLQYCTNLKAANFAGNPIEDASALSNLGRLRRLNLNGAKIKDLSFITNGEIFLIDLEINNTGIRDLSPLKKKNKGWQYLSASGNHLTDEDIAVFSDLNVENLDVSNNDITDPSVFNHMKDVENFILKGNHISDLSGVGNINFNYDAILPGTTSVTPYCYQAYDQTITRFAKNGKVSSIIKDYDGTLLNDEKHLKNFVNVRLNGNEFELIDPNKPGSVEFAADEYNGEVHFNGIINIVSLVSVMVTPETVTLEPGKTQQFTGTVVGQGEFDRTVTWSVIGGGAGTSVDANGLLTVGKNETAKTLTVRATSNADNKVFGEATVTVKENAPVVEPTVTGITVTPENATVKQGKTQKFTADVKGTGDFDKTVKWSVIGGKEGTSIAADGTLTVAKDENAKTLTVRATSNANGEIFVEATVTVQKDENKPDQNKPAVNTKDNSAAPSTGDASPLGMSIVIMMIGTAGLFGLTARRRKKDTI